MEVQNQIENEEVKWALLAGSISLAEINGQLWDIEDELRLLESKQDFGERFIELARSVYKVNDKRAKAKKDINLLVGSELVEEKLHPEY